MTDFARFGVELHSQAGHYNHRYCVLVSGQEKWTWKVAQQLCQCFEPRRIVAISTSQVQPAGESFPVTIDPGQARRFLGTETSSVVVDCHGDFAPDAVGILAGTISAGGFLILVAPVLDAWPGHRAKSTPAFQSAPDPASLPQSSIYITRMRRILLDSSQVVRIEQGKAPGSLPKVPDQALPSIICLDDQALAVKSVKKVVSGQRRRPVVLLSDRGRGKSAALGLAARDLLDPGSGSGLAKIIVTGAGMASVQTVFKHAETGVDKVDGLLEYWPPDKLVKELPETGLLLVDEAASIALPILHKLLESYPRIAFASTVHGYEGTGRGFILKFGSILDAHSRGWKRCELLSPVRWANGDPLEALVLDLLLMNAEIADSELEPGKYENPQFEVMDRQSLGDNDALLREIFALLTQAHYRTRPADLLQLLDGHNLKVMRLHHHAETLAVALVAGEGSIAPTHALPVWMNKRRPRHHLVPEILCAQLGFIEAMQMNSARIVRIVVKPGHQRNGLGSQLLGQVSRHYDGQVDLLGTTFGVSPGLLDFWLENGYRAARVGVGESHNTGTHSCLLVKGKTRQGKQLQAAAEEKLLRNMPYQLTESLRTLDPEIVCQIYSSSSKPQSLSGLDTQDLEDLVAVGWAGRSLADAASAMAKLAQLAICTGPGSRCSTHRKFLVEKFLQQKRWQECLALSSPRSKKAGSALCREIVKQVLTGEYQSRTEQIMKKFGLTVDSTNEAG